MRCLLDVNALLALVFTAHGFHTEVERWVRSSKPQELATCAITELGFVRILSQLSQHNVSVESAQKLLAHWKVTSPVPTPFLTDDLGVDLLPKWVKQPAQTTDGHLSALARKHGTVLATFDRGIPGALLIPS